MSQSVGEAVIVKGGLVLELRLARARTTKDVDLRMTGTPTELLERLREAGRLDLQDFLRFEVQRDRRHPELRGEGMKYTGHRFTTECRLAGKVYGRPVWRRHRVRRPDRRCSGRDRRRRHARVCRRRTGTSAALPCRFAPRRKAAAYTLPRSRPNSRIKDLPDIALLATVGPIQASTLRSALEKTFRFRGTHDLPADLPSPPATWEAAYLTMVKSDGLAWPTLGQLHHVARAFLEPVLSRRVSTGCWTPDSWTWGRDG
ncbi:MAG: nucleotidyl transferase AbiEii/AbiGii toxin family protein [Planctomycetota bacterium]